jgi:hypothetical protein
MSAISAIKVTRIRVIADDRLGRDRSSQACSGNNNARLVGHFTGGDPHRPAPEPARHPAAKTDSGFWRGNASHGGSICEHKASRDCGSV